MDREEHGRFVRGSVFRLRLPIVVVSSLRSGLLASLLPLLAAVGCDK